jgi:hypothetical protein
MIPSRIYKRRKVWHWLADAGAPEWLWKPFVRSTWRRCATCGIRGVGRWKNGYRGGGGRPPAHFCSADCSSAEAPF